MWIGSRTIQDSYGTIGKSSEIKNERLGFNAQPQVYHKTKGYDLSLMMQRTLVHVYIIHCTSSSIFQLDMILDFRTQFIIKLSHSDINV